MQAVRKSKQKANLFKSFLTLPLHSHYMLSINPNYASCLLSAPYFWGCCLPLPLIHSKQTQWPHFVPPLCSRLL